MLIQKRRENLHHMTLLLIHSTGASHVFCQIYSLSFILELLCKAPFYLSVAACLTFVLTFIMNDSFLCFLSSFFLHMCLSGFSLPEGLAQQNRATSQKPFKITLATTVMRHGAFLTHKPSPPFMQRNKPNI